MGTEIERKYRLDGSTWQTPDVLASGKEILQGYFTTKGGIIARIEDDGSQRLVIERRENGVRLSDVNQADLGDGLVAEIDVYSGANAGLKVVEVELPSEDTAVPALPWIGEDVSDGELGNAGLALQPWTSRNDPSVMPLKFGI